MNTKLLATLKDQDIFPDKKIATVNKLQLRKTVKIIALNKNNQVALVTNSIHGFYLLPGGGIEDSEEIEQAAARECEEEIAYGINSQVVIGRIKEFRNRDGKEYDTYCVSAKIIKPTGEDKRTDNEKKLGLNVEWFDLDKASEIFLAQENKLKTGQVEFYNTGFNIVRDKIFFEYFIKNYAG